MSEIVKMQVRNARPFDELLPSKPESIRGSLKYLLAFVGIKDLPKSNKYLKRTV